MLEEYIYRGSEKLRCGYTTGSCSAGAAKAAAAMLFSGEKIEQVSLMTPKGVALILSIEDIKIEKDRVSCAVKKDSGDDADITNGILVYATVIRREDMRDISISGGEGIGRVTKAGLDQPVGEAAINSVPRRMIREALEEEREQAGYEAGLEVVISIPEGEAIAKKTFNPRLGIAGGLSILGTTGIVEPMSEQALMETIRTEWKVQVAAGRQYILMTPGNYGLEFIKNNMGLHLEGALKCSNFIGETLDLAYEYPVKGVLLVGHIGKLVKLGAGIMQTHSRYADGRMETLCSAALLAGADELLCRRILDCITTDSAIALLQEAGMRKVVMETLMDKIMYHVRHRVPNNLQTGIVLFSNQFGILGKSEAVEELVQNIKKEQPLVCT